MDNFIIYNTDDAQTNVKLYANDGTVWLTQAQMAELFQTTKQNVSQHLKHCYEDKELVEDSVVKYFLTTAADGKKYNTAFYSLDAILAVGFRVRSPRGTQLQQYADGGYLKEHTKKAQP